MTGEQEKKTFVEFYNLLTYSVIRTDAERESEREREIRLYEFNFHVDVR